MFYAQLSCSASTATVDMFLGGNWSAPVFHIMGSIFDDAVLVHKKLIVMCYILLAIDIPVATNSLVALPGKT